MVLLLSGYCISGLQVAIDLTETPENTGISVQVIDPPEREILESLRSGTRSEILFHVKIYREKTGAGAFLPDKLLAEYQILREASYRRQEESYLVSEGILFSSFRDEDSLMQAFLTLRDFTIPASVLGETDPEENVYILVRVRLSTVKLLPPLTILNLVLPESRLVSPWPRKTLSLPRNR
jgi:hypothetical protein